MKIKLIDFGGRAPERAKYNDAGADVFVHHGALIPARSTLKVGLGFGVEIPDGYAGFIFPRSGFSAQGIVCELPPIDSGYRGEVHAIVTNQTGTNFYLNPGVRIGQLVIIPCILADFCSELGEERGTDAFGSTGR